MRIAAIGVLAVLLGTSAIARDDDRYGAIAYSRRTGHFGVSSHSNSRGAAEQRALESCEGRDCRVQVWFRNSCGALATGQDGRIFGWAHDTSLRQAKEVAIEHCRTEGGHRCTVLTSVCTR